MRRMLTMAVVVALAVTACTGTVAEREPSARQGEARPQGDPAFLPDDLVLAGDLAGFERCDDFLDHVQTHALELVTPWGLGGHHRFGSMEGDVADERAAGDASDGETAGQPSAPVEGEDFSGTNVQETGVDEPDTVKTDGETMYVVGQGRLIVLDVTGDEPEQLATLSLDGADDARLLLDGDRLLVTSSAHGVIPFEGERSADVSYPGSGWSNTTTVTLLDVGDRTAPQAVERLTVDGSTLSSRLVDGVARIVVRTEQGNLPWVTPEGSGLRAERRALEANRRLIRASEAEDWIPYAVHETADGRDSEGPLLACDRIARPSEFAGLGVLSVLTVDLASGGLDPGGSALGVLSGGESIYASRDRLYVASARWIDREAVDGPARDREPERMITGIHAFDTSDPRDVHYLGSGEVPGTLLSQWSMSEYDGHLRVASTTGDTWWRDGQVSESVVTVLQLQDGGLVRVGQVDGLGITERIYAVRFMGDVGYVVTFRQTDPLYTLDLTDPTDPEVVGELKILGYSAYLHPVGEDLLLGVGQDADERGRTKGTQLSLFDVADPADPRRIAQVTIGEGSSDVEYDHHAFLHWPATGLTVVPFVRWGWDAKTETEDIEAGAVAFTAGRDQGIERRRVLSHAPLHLREIAEDAEVSPDQLWEYGWRSQIRRSVVVGDRLVTVSEVGVATHDLGSLEDLGWHSFDR